MFTIHVKNIMNANIKNRYMVRMMKVKWISVIPIVLFMCFFLLFKLYFNLDIGVGPVKADIIIDNEGVFEERAEKSTELLQEGYADRILVSPSLPYVLEWFYELGVDDSQIVREEEATSTWTNAVNSLQIMEDNGWDSALIVSSDYHIRRVRLSYERAKESLGMDVELTYISAYPLEDGEEVRYVNYPRHAGLAAEEVFKYLGYLLRLYYVIDL